MAISVNDSTNTVIRTAVLATALAAAATKVPAAEQEDKFIADIKSDDEDVAYAAWSTAEKMSPQVIPPLSKLLAADKPLTRKAAEQALNNLVHSVGKEIDPAGLAANAGRPDDPGKQNTRQQIVAQILGLLDGKRQHVEKVTALRHLSLLATVDDVASIAKHVHDEQLREEVVFCLERIPGKTAEEALLAALPDAADDFKPRILAALGHRQAEEAIGACIEAMKSPDLTIAMAAMKAAGRIGTRSGADAKLPDYNALSDWQKTEYRDSLLRYADAQVASGNPDEAWPIYEDSLGREEGHWQCAAIIGLAKIGTARAAAAIFPKLKSSDNTVRITARKNWEAMAADDA